VDYEASSSSAKNNRQGGLFPCSSLGSQWMGSAVPTDYTPQRFPLSGIASLDEQILFKYVEDSLLAFGKEFCFQLFFLQILLDLCR
jgi:hypothetical protein